MENKYRFHPLSFPPTARNVALPSMAAKQRKWKSKKKIQWVAKKTHHPPTEPGVAPPDNARRRQRRRLKLRTANCEMGTGNCELASGHWNGEGEREGEGEAEWELFSACSAARGSARQQPLKFWKSIIGKMVEKREEHETKRSELCAPLPWPCCFLFLLFGKPGNRREGARGETFLHCKHFYLIFQYS